MSAQPADQEIYRSEEDRHLRRSLGFWSLTAISFGGIIGSGWLFGAFFAAQAAGPASIVSWIIGGGALLLIALVMTELGRTRPESGGLVRWPLYSNGRLAATLVGWAIWLAYSANPPSESAAVMQYASQHVPGLYQHGVLTALGLLAAVLLMALFVVLNYLGVKFFARVNLVITIFKFVIPALTIIALFASGFHSSHLTSHGFAPSGWAAALSAIATAGIIYAYTGFQGPIDMAGEVSNVRRHLPLAMIAAFVLSMLVYVGLQIAFVGAVPGSQLAHGWSGINFNAPFAQLAVVLNLGWLSWLLYADALVSPSGSALVFTAEDARETYGMAKNRFFPRLFEKVDPRNGVPVRALLLNFALGLIFLLPFKSWHAIVSVFGVLGLFSYVASAIAVISFRRTERAPLAGWIPGMHIIAPVSFVIASEIIYWATWSNLRIALPALLAAVLIYGYSVARRGVSLRDAKDGLWLVAYVAALLVMSAVGSFGGQRWIPQPWDSVIVAVIGYLTYRWGVASAMERLGVLPAPAPIDFAAPEARDEVA